MNRLRFVMVFAVAVLALATLLPIATSADRGLAVTSTPTPTTGDRAGQPTQRGDNVVCVDMSTVTGGTADPQGIFGQAGAGYVPDAQAMEHFRRELFDFLNELEALSNTLPTASIYQSDAQFALKKARFYIRQMTPEQLYLYQRSFQEAGTDLNALRSDIETATAQALASRQPAVETGRTGNPAPNSFPSVPTPTPDLSGIVHTSTTQKQTNNTTGDLFPPGWPTDVGCPEKGYSTEVLFGMMVAVDALKAVQIGLDTWCKEKTVTCPGANAQDPIGCWIAAGFKFVLNLTEDVKAGFQYCNGNATSARIEAIYQDTRILHASLHEHDQGLISRMVSDDQFLFDFRNLNLRLNIEANLASPDDNPHVLLALPRRFCISSGLEELTANPANASYDPLAPEALAGCGLLEVVSDTVKSAIDMTKNTNLSVNNAEAERQAAIEHYKNGQWKLAFDRFRKAYREAVRP